MTDYTRYVATEILSEQRTLSYRNVARACKVHVNAAKRMLYDFYNSQTKRKPGSVYATYLVAGVKKVESVQNGITNGHHSEDVHIPSSPPPFTSSMLEPSQRSEEESGTPVRTITLVREESLEDVKNEYETVTSLHIYSVSPTKLQDLVVLTDISRGLYADVFVKEDPLQHSKTYGVIQNPEVRRRKGKRPILPSGPASKFQPAKEPARHAAPKTEDTASRPSSRDSTITPPKQPTLKRGGSSILSAFSKTQPPKPKNDSQDTKMSDDEGESEDEAMFLDTGTTRPAKKRGSDAKKEREDKAAKLRKMMDDDEDEIAAAPKVEDAAANAGPIATDQPDADDQEGNVAWSNSEGEKGVAAKQDEGPKRRRGKRKVMKKRTMKDEDGYLVTKEEPVWESFSESEKEDTKPVKAAFPKSQPSQTQKSAAGKGTQKKGKADIMSFFGKKA